MSIKAAYQRALAVLPDNFLVAAVAKEVIRRKNLSLLARKIRTCTKCPLGLDDAGVPGRGPIEADIMFVGEAPGEDEAGCGLPFVGAAGVVLSAALSTLSIPESEVYITNLVRCRPPDNRNPSASEVDVCLRYLMHEIDLVDPKIMITLGRVPAGFFLEKVSSLGSVRGTKIEWESRLLIPTWHPAYILRGNKEAFHELVSDIHMAYDETKCVAT